MLQLEMILGNLNDDVHISELFGFSNLLTLDTSLDHEGFSLKLKTSETLMKMLLINLGFYTVSFSKLLRIFLAKSWLDYD